MRHRRNRNAEVLLARDFETKKHSWKKKKFLTKLTEHSFEPHRQQHEVVHVYGEIFAGVTNAQHLVQAAAQTVTWNHRVFAALWSWQVNISLVTLRNVAVNGRHSHVTDHYTQISEKRRILFNVKPQSSDIFSWRQEVHWNNFRMLTKIERKPTAVCPVKFPNRRFKERPNKLFFGKLEADFSAFAYRELFVTQKFPACDNAADSRLISTIVSFNCSYRRYHDKRATKSVGCITGSALAIYHGLLNKP